MLLHKLSLGPYFFFFGCEVLNRDPDQHRDRCRNFLHDSDAITTHTEGQQRIKKKMAGASVTDGELKYLLLPHPDGLSEESCWVMAQTALINTR